MSGLTPAERKEYEDRCEYAQTNFEMFARIVLDIKPARHQREWIPICQEIGDNPTGQKFCIIAPPGSGKSTMVAVGFLAWMIGRHPEKHYGLVSFSTDPALERSLAIRNLIEHSQIYRDVFPNVLPDFTAWDKASFRVRRENLADLHPTLRATGATGAVVSYRLNGLVIDDPHDPKNVTTPRQREKVWTNYIDAIRTRLTADAWQLTIGTRWSDDDFIGRLLKMKHKGERLWKFVHIPALDSRGRTYWPEEYPQEVLDEKRYTQPANFAIQYQGDTTGGETQIIQRVGTYEEDPTPKFAKKKDLMVASGWDTALKRKQENDFSVGYCLNENTPILTRDLRWVPAKAIKVGDTIIGFDEYLSGSRRRFQEATVLYNSRKQTSGYKVTLDNGDVLRTTSEHQFLVRTVRTNPDTGSHSNIVWRSVKYLYKHLGKGKGGRYFLPQYFSTWEYNSSRKAGYLAGAFDGEGCLTRNKNGNQAYRLIFVQKDNAMLAKVKQYLTDLKFDYAETISQSEVHSLEIKGGMAAIWRFLGEIRPQRLLDKFLSKNLSFSGLRLTHNLPEIISIEPVHNLNVAQIVSSSKTYISAGYASHNTGGLDKNGRVWVLDRVKGRWGVPELATKIEESWEKWEQFAVWIEDATVCTPAIDTLMESVPAVPTESVSFSGDKINHAHTLAAWIHGGHVVFPRFAEWFEDCKYNLTHFPYIDHDDDPDALFVLCSKLLEQRHPAMYSQRRPGVRLEFR